MKTKRILTFIIALPVVFFASGCWDAHDIQRKNIALTIFADAKAGGCRLGVEIAKTVTSPGQGEDPQEPASILFGEGATFEEAQADLGGKSDNALFLNVVRVLALGKNLAAEGIESYLNKLRGVTGYRNAYVVTARDDIDDLVTAAPDNNVYIGMAIESALDDLVKREQAVAVSVQDILKAEAAGNPSFVLPAIAKEDGRVAFTGYSIFAGAKEVGFLPAAESRGLVCLKGKHAQFSYTAEAGGKTSELSAGMTKRTVSVKQTDGAPAFEVSFNFDCAFLYADENIRYTKNEIDQLMENVKAQIESDLNRAIWDSQDAYGCDYLDFYKYYKAKYAAAYREMDWTAAYRKASISVKVNVKYANSGHIQLTVDS